MIPTAETGLTARRPHPAPNPYMFQQEPPGPPSIPPSDGGDGEGREEDDQDERDEVARRRDRQRIKEADEVRILVFPQGTAWRAWRNNTIHSIVSAAGRHDDSALEWIM